MLVVAGAGTFAGVNAASTLLYRHGRVTIVTLYLIRSAAVYVMNGLFVASRDGLSTAWAVLTLRTGSPSSTRLACFRSMFAASMALGLNLSFLWLTCADAFTIFKGTSTLATIVITSTCLGSAERLTPYEVVCGALVVVGIALIAQPPALFALFGEKLLMGVHSPRHEALQHESPDATNQSQPSWTPHAGPGVSVAILSGSLSAGVGALTRVLSHKGGGHEGHTPPPMLLSFLVVTMFVFFGILALIGRASGLAHAAGWGWLSFAWPVDVADWKCDFDRGPNRHRPHPSQRSSLLSALPVLTPCGGSASVRTG